MPTGAFADLYGFKMSVVLGHFICAGSCIMIALSPKCYAVFLLWAVLSAICCTLSSGAMEALQYESLREETRQGEYPVFRGRLLATGSVTRALATGAGGVICQLAGFSTVVALGGLTGMISTAVLASMREPGTTRLERQRRNGVLAQALESLRAVRSDKALGGIVVTGAAAYAAYNLVQTYSQPCLIRVGIASYAIVGFISATMLLAFSLLSWLAGRLKDRFGSKRLLAFICGAPIAALVGLGALERSVLLVPLYLSKIGEGLADPIVSEIAIRRCPSGKIATVLSIQSLLASLLFSIGSLASGFGLDRAGALITFSAGAGVLFLVFTWGLPRAIGPQA
jgi:MFS family permease